MSVKDKVILITGAGGGIGCATAVKFAKEGAKLILVDLNENVIKSTLKKVEEHTDEVLFVPADVTKSDDVKNFVDKTVERHGRIDVFFNNAGIDAEVNSMDDYNEEMFDNILNVNTKGVFLSLKYVLQVMRKQESGSIINTASIHGMFGISNRGAYVASKHAVIGLTRTAASENASLNIRVNAVCPATVVTNITKKVAESLNPENIDEHFDLMKAKIPANRFGKPEDIANLVKFLASDDSGFITGAVIPIDGGTTATLSTR